MSSSLSSPLSALAAAGSTWTGGSADSGGGGGGSADGWRSPSSSDSTTARRPVTYNYSAHPLRLLNAWVSCDEQRDVNKQECPLYEKAIIHAALLVSDDDPEGKKPKTSKLDEAPFCRLVSGEISDCDELASLSKHHLEAGDTALSATKRVVAPSPEPPPRPRSFRKEGKVLVTWGRKREEVIPPFPPRPLRRRGGAPPPQAPALT